MSETTGVSWTDATYNPWIGCRAVSSGCERCFARTLVNGRMGGDFSKRRRTAPATFNAPLRWNRKPWVCDECGQAFKERWQHYAGPTGAQECLGRSYHPRRVFLGSLMDIFDPEVPAEWLAETLDVVRRCPEMIFQFVTKRPELFSRRMDYALQHAKWKQMEDLAHWIRIWGEPNPPRNVWMITSVEDQQRADERIPALLRIPALIHGLSVEPLLEPIKFARVPGLNRMGAKLPDWIVCGGESGTGFRDCGVEAIEDVARQCQAAGIATFVKQDAGRLPGKQGRISKATWELKQFPERNQ